MCTISSTCDKNLHDRIELLLGSVSEGLLQCNHTVNLLKLKHEHVYTILSTHSIYTHVYTILSTHSIYTHVHTILSTHSIYTFTILSAHSTYMIAYTVLSVHSIYV